MEKEPEKEIFVDPRNSILMDGSGYRALCAGGITSTDKEGREIITFTIKPDSIVRKRYNWRGGKEIDELGNTKIIIAVQDLIKMNVYDDANRMFLYEKSFNHDETELSQRHKLIKMELDRLRRENQQLDAENIKLSETNHILRTNPEKAIAVSSVVFQKIAKGLSDINRKDDK